MVEHLADRHGIFEFFDRVRPQTKAKNLALPATWSSPEEGSSSKSM